MTIFKKYFLYLMIVFLPLPVIASEELPDIKYDKFTLPNGLRVIVHEAVSYTHLTLPTKA